VKRYGIVLTVAVALALGIGLLARAPRPAPRPAPAPAPAPTVALTVTFTDDGARPEAATVPANHRVRLTLVNAGARAIDVKLAGYEDRLAPGTLAKGATWNGAFLADRPGEAFAWLVDGEPRGRLSVSGSHLVEGHR
jgi:hypothetical protein